MTDFTTRRLSSSALGSVIIFFSALNQIILVLKFQNHFTDGFWFLLSHPVLRRWRVGWFSAMCTFFRSRRRARCQLGDLSGSHKSKNLISIARSPDSICIKPGRVMKCHLGWAVINTHGALHYARCFRSYLPFANEIPAPSHP